MKIATTFACVFLLLAPGTTTAQQVTYDPSITMAKVTVDEDRFSYDGREVPLRLYLPDSSAPSPVVLFSHGLGGSRDAASYLGKHWAGRGYAVVAMQHAGSDSRVIQDVPIWKKLQALKKAATAENAAARYADVKATLDYLEKQTAGGGKYERQFDMTKVGMSGHSFGAITTQAVSGQNYKFKGQMHTDKRIDAAIALSPSPPSYGHDQDTFAKVNVPWLLMTGTKDSAPIGSNGDAQSRRKVFEGLPASGHFYELVLNDALHSAFVDSSRRRDFGRNPNHHAAIMAIGTAFWDAYLRDDQAALTWLNQPEARSVLEADDQWQKK